MNAQAQSTTYADFERNDPPAELKAIHALVVQELNKVRAEQARKVKQMSVDELKEYVGKLAPEEKDRDWLTRDIAASAINLLSTKQPA